MSYLKKRTKYLNDTSHDTLCKAFRKVSFG